MSRDTVDLTGLVLVSQTARECLLTDSAGTLTLLRKKKDVWVKAPLMAPLSPDTRKGIAYVEAAKNMLKAARDMGFKRTSIVPLLRECGLRANMDAMKAFVSE